MFQEHRDLCSACEHVRTCPGRSTPDSPITTCKYYTEHAPSYPANIVGVRGGNGSCMASIAGLCASCQLRDTCRLPKPEGGVWQCEEYV